MKPTPRLTLIKTAALLVIFTNRLVNCDNLTCYQCTKKSNAECSTEELQPCSPIHDRCVTHITKDAKRGFEMKRECGLGPCNFNDAMVDKGLGFDKCDRSRDEYSCIFCCKGNGCNKNSAPAIEPKFVLLIVMTLVIMLNVVKDFQPPYLPRYN